MPHRMRKGRRAFLPETAKGLPAAAIDVDAVQAPGFGLAEEYGPFASPEHSHQRHQLLYAAAGSMRLFAAGAQWLLPPQRAAFIPTGVVHRVRSDKGISLR